MIKKRQLANPRHGFFLIVRPEEQLAGAPDPVKWIDALMQHQALDYRISLLRAAAHYGSSHQAAMVFQVVAPKQLRDFEIGRHRLQFLYQTPRAFAQVNVPGQLGQMKSDAGFAIVAGVELTLLDRASHLRQAGALAPFVKQAKTALRLDPAVKPLLASLSEPSGKSVKWKLVINEPAEADYPDLLTGRLSKD